MRITKQSQREMIAAAFDYAKQQALFALDNKCCTDMRFYLEFGVDRCPVIKSNIEELFVKSN